MQVTDSSPAYDDHMPNSIAAILTALAADPGRPRLTWYGADGERIELSGAVLNNWVTKTTNLLVEELDDGPNTVIALDLPPHWRTLVWGLAIWRAGGHLLHAPPNAAADASIAVTNQPAGWLRADGTLPPRLDLVAVTLPALARSFDGDLPARAIDAASAVMTYGDQLGWVPETDPTAPAISGIGVGDTPVSHAALLQWAATNAGFAPAAGARVLLQLEHGAAALAGLLAAALAVWAADGSVVILAPSVTADLATDLPRRDRLVSTERVTQEA